FFRWHGPFEHAEQILRGDAMTGLVKKGVVDRRPAGDEAADDVDLRHVVVRPAGVTGQTLGIGDGGEKDDGVAAELDVLLERLQLLRRQRLPRRIELERLERGQIDGKNVGCSGSSHKSRSNIPAAAPARKGQGYNPPSKEEGAAMSFAAAVNRKAIDLGKLAIEMTTAAG